LINKKSKYSTIGLRVFINKKLSPKKLLRELVKEDEFSILIIRSGFLNIQLKSSIIYLSENEFTMIAKRTSIEFLERSDQLRVCLVSFSSEFIFEFCLKRPPIGYFEFMVAKAPVKVSLKSKEANQLIDSFKLIDRKRRNSDKHPFKNELVSFSFNMLLYELASIYSNYSSNIRIRNSRKEKLVLQFLRLLDMNYRTQHSVNFYADALMISAGNLTKSVKQVMDKTSSQLIGEAIVFEAKILLQNNDLTILSIIDTLQFCNISSFSIFFKKYTSFSPAEYRLRLNNY
jgi:AraC family transcriptional activator of pobA